MLYLMMRLKRYKGCIKTIRNSCLFELYMIYKTRRDKYNNNEVMIDLYDEVLNILSGNYQDIKDNSLYISIYFI